MDRLRVHGKKKDNVVGRTPLERGYPEFGTHRFDRSYFVANEYSAHLSVPTSALINLGICPRLTKSGFEGR